jgi:hypothetical protein
MAIEGIEVERRRVTDEVHASIRVAVNRQKAAVGIALITKLHELSMVNEGTLRRGWYATSPRPSNEDRQSDDAIAGVVQLVAEAAMGDPLYIQNNTPHAIVYETGTFEPANPGPSKGLHVPKSSRQAVAGRTLIVGGYHVQAPRGFTADAIDAVASEFGLERTVSGS